MSKVSIELDGPEALDLLERMGCTVLREDDRVTLHGPKAALRGLGEGACRMRT